METEKSSMSENSRLRNRAESFISKAPSAVNKVPPEDVKKLVEELQIYQVELEMQNEELRRAQLELEQTRDRYVDLYDFAPAGYFTISDKGMIQEANLTGAAMLGVERRELINQPLSRFINSDDQDTFYLHRQKLIETKTKQACELRFKTENDSQFHARLDCVVVEDDQGNIECFRATVSDIEERMRALKAIEQGKKEWETTFHSISDWICILDLEHRIIRSNKSVTVFTGQSVEEVIGQTCCRVVHGSDDPIAGCPFQRMLKTRRRESAELHLPEKNIWLLVMVDPLMDDDGKLTGAVHIVRDITALKKEEEERARIEKLESLGVLAGGLAHDFNNILSIIVGNVSCAAMDEVQDPDTRNLLEEAQKACMRAANLTRQLLTFAKGGAPVKETASLNEAVRESVDFALKGSNVRCDYVIPEDIRPAEIDVGQINQVMHNLIINADQAMPEGGVIQVSMENSVIGPEDALSLPPGNYIRINIKDHGVGIPQTHLPKIFDPYFSTKDKGSGLGLATAHSIIQRHGGRILVDSQLGIGTVFDIYLPATEKEIADTAETEGVSLQGHGRILVMDDEEMLRNLATKILRRLGYEVESAKDGEEALSKYMKAMKEERPFDVVILDLTIPGGIGGKETIKRLREIDTDVKAIVASGYSDDPVVAYFRDYGFCGSIPKPYGIAVLSQAVRDVLGKDEG